MLSVWILGTGLRAHVEPFEDRGNDDGDMYIMMKCVFVTFYPHFREWCVCLFVTFYPHFLEGCVCVSVCYVLSSLPR